MRNLISIGCFLELMLGKKKPPTLNSSSGVIPQIKYPHPKILLLDLQDDICSALKGEGYNISIGSFGTPYQVQKNDSYLPVIVNGKIPRDHAEQEIIIINLVPRDVLKGPEGEKATSEGKNDWWASCSSGIIDPRPRRMAQLQDSFSNILLHGGIFIIFAEKRIRQEIVIGHIFDGLHLKIEKHLSSVFDNWSFLPTLAGLKIEYLVGKEISLIQSKVKYILQDYLKNAVYNCTISPIYKKIEEQWYSLAENKFGSSVSCAIGPEDTEGWIFIFPQLDNKADFLIRFLDDFLSDLSPKLFPFSERSNWLHRSEYELPKILEIKNKICCIQEKAEAEISKLENECELERNNLGYLHDLISTTGYPLVTSVKKALETIGFTPVIDVDEEMKKSHDTSPKREDLRICDESPILLIEVKGISGLPKDEDALQVWKYLLPRRKELGRDDIRGLSIINHQKHLPPLDRENISPFRDDVLINAKEYGFGLLTTWDLFKLTRSFLQNGWKHDVIRDLFYLDGRIVPVPSHYEYIGLIEDYAEKAGAVGVRIEAGDLKLRERIAFELPIEFKEQNIESMELDRRGFLKTPKSCYVFIYNL